MEHDHDVPGGYDFRLPCYDPEKDDQETYTPVFEVHKKSTGGYRILVGGKPIDTDVISIEATFTLDSPCTHELRVSETRAGYSLKKKSS